VIRISENLAKEEENGGRERVRVESMEVGMLPISASKRGKLLAAGYTSLDAIARTSASLLARGFFPSISILSPSFIFQLGMLYVKKSSFFFTHP